MSGLTRSPFLWFAFLLAALEVLSWQTSPYRLGRKADQTTRNATKHRGWPEYLDVKDDKAPLVALISNSQGVGGEIEDRNAIYAASLKDHLARRGFRFENWSTGGLRTTEIELLTMKAVQRGVDHLVLVLTVNNFDPDEQLNLDFPFSDITLLAGEPSLWPELRDSLFISNTRFEDLAVRFMARWSSLVRSRIAVTDLVAAHLPLEWHRLALGHEVRPGSRLDDLESPEISLYFPAIDVTEEQLARRRAMLNTNPRDYDPDGIERRLETFERLYPILRERAKRSGMRLTWVWNPLAPGSTTDEGRSVRNSFIERASRTIERGGSRSHDLSDSMKSGYFLSHGHFNEDGHREFARMMKEILDVEVTPLEDGR